MNDFIQEALYDDVLMWAPAGNYSAQTGEYKAGLGHASLSYAAGAVIRGGYWDDDLTASAFVVALGDEPSATGINLGFRCVFAP